MMKSKKFLAVAVLVVFVALSIVGCKAADVPSNTTVTSFQGVASNPVTIYGKVIDKQTKQGLAGATVKVKLNGAWLSTTTASDSSTLPDSAAGDWSIANLPAGTILTVYVKGPAVTATQTKAYVSTVFTVGTNDYTAQSDGINGMINQDLGQFAMEQGVTVTVRVVDTAGTPITLSSGAALPVSLLTSNLGSVLETMATRDATDTNKYTIVTAQTGTTVLTIPALDVNGDGKYDYTGGTATIVPNGGYITGQADLTTNIVLSAIDNTTRLKELTTSVKTYGYQLVTGPSLTVNSLSMIGKSDPVIIVFNMPLTAASVEQVTMTYLDVFKSLPTSTSDVETEKAVTVTLSNDNTFLTIQPTSALIEGMTYNIKGTVNTTANPTDDTVNSVIISRAVMAKMTPTLDESGNIDVAAITVDNFNSYTNGILASNGTGTANPFGNAKLVFPEPVWGTVRIISKTTGTITPTTVLCSTGPGAACSPNPQDIAGQGMGYYVAAPLGGPNTAVVQFNSRTGTRTGVLFVATNSLGSMPDNTPVKEESFVLGLDIYDADGNTLVKEASFNVR